MMGFKGWLTLGVMGLGCLVSSAEPTDLAQRLRDLEIKEGILSEHYASLKEQKNDIVSVRNRVADFVNSLTPAEWQWLGTPEESRLPVFKARNLKALKEFLHEADDAQKTFLTELDAYGHEKMNAYIEEIHASSFSFLTECLKQVDRTQPKAHGAHQKLLQSFASQFEAYEKIKTSEKLERPGEYNKIVRGYLDTFGRLLGAVQNAEGRPLTLRLKELQAALRATLDTSAALLEIAPSLGKLTAQAARRPYTPPPGQSPTLKALDETLKSLARARHQKVAIIGRENIPKLRDPRELNIIVPIHRDIYTDPSIVAHLDLEAYHVFVAHKRFIPNHWLINWADLQGRIHDNRDFLPVGERGGESIERMFERLDKGGVRTLVIFPEGTTSLSGEIGPIPETFVRSFIDQLLARGYRPNIIPLTTDLPPGLRQGPAERLQSLTRKGAVLTGRLLPAWSPTELRIYRSLGDRQVITRLLRAEWLSALPTNDQVLMGQLRARPMADDLRQFLSRRIGPSSPTSCVIQHLNKILSP